MRVSLSLATGLIASLALLGACQKEPSAEAYADNSPPPSVEATEIAPLAGGPSAQTQATASQSADDAYIAGLESRGLMAERRYNPATGQTTLVVFNRPIANPTLRGGPRTRYASAGNRSRVAGSMRGGVYAQSSRSSSASSAASASSAVAANSASSAATAAPSANAAATAENAAPVDMATGPGVQPIPQAAAGPAPVQVTDPARAGFTMPKMSPMMMGIIALIILALLVALFVANRPKPRRHSPNLSGHQAPPEASGGDHHGEAHA